MRPLSSPSRRTNQQQTGCIHLTSCNPSVRMYRNRSGPFRILPYRMRIDLAIIGLLITEPRSHSPNHTKHQLDAHARERTTRVGVISHSQLRFPATVTRSSIRVFKGLSHNSLSKSE